ncbi:MAG: helix-turn-helix transcriptional regulator [Anaerolineales bacterium]|nr:helix-turn-helix transcriptional regulator [Anaerolineales bacterium]
MFAYTILGLLARQPHHGYDLKRAIEQALGGSREINFGQIYTTLGRLERDGLAEVQSEADDGRGKKTYRITAAGRRELEAWLDQPVVKNESFKDAFLVKLIVRHLAGYGDALAAITRQRQAYLKQLRGLTALAAEKADQPFVSLLAEGAILHLQADLRWLDLCDERLESLESSS